jgi:glycine dehydrogenase subunit 2
MPGIALRGELPLPEVSENDVARHYLRLSQRNFGVESGFYPLGSCTMKYNPKINEAIARMPGFSETHPAQARETVEGNLELMVRLQEWIAEIGGFDAVSLQPAAGAHGELAALLMIKAYHRDRGEERRRQVLIPDSAHGTNPASTSMAGLEVLEIPSDARGNVDIEGLRAACDDTVAAIMLTNPNTLGLFEEQVRDITALVHGCGGIVYGDGANMNALTGIVRPAALGIDLMHFNLHKTFSTPHGGGGPGSGPLGAARHLADYLPGPVAVRGPDGRYDTAMPKRSIGRMCTWFGNFAMLVRAYAYIRMHGGEGLKQNAFHAVLNANYLRMRLKDTYKVPFERTCMHEFVCEGAVEGTSVRAIDVCKRLMDHGFHPPTNYFPLIVHEALMIEPTETESKPVLDAFADAMLAIAREARTDPQLLFGAPHATPVGRLDEVKAARDLRLSDAAAPGANGSG